MELWLWLCANPGGGKEEEEEDGGGVGLGVGGWWLGGYSITVFQMGKVFSFSF